MQTPTRYPSVAAALEAMGLSRDPFRDAEEQGQWWTFGVFGFAIPCYNFAWRRQALPVHDLHHVVTGYPVSMPGEFQVAAWEFAAGRFPSLFSNLFCLPLIGLGLVHSPAKVFGAFQHGLFCRSLYGQNPWLSLNGRLETMTVAELKVLTSKPKGAPTKLGTAAAFAAVSLLSVSEIVLLALVPILPVIGIAKTLA
jgi:hypothetical protein